MSLLAGDSFKNLKVQCGFSYDVQVCININNHDTQYCFPLTMLGVGMFSLNDIRLYPKTCQYFIICIAIESTKLGESSFFGKGAPVHFIPMVHNDEG